MKQLVTRIQQEGVVRDASILDVSSFFNAKIDPRLMQAIGEDFHKAFEDLAFDLYVTVESSGIAPTLFASLASNKPCVIIKKEVHDGKYVSVPCYSYTKNTIFHLTVNPDFIRGKRIVFIDDFLADGNVMDACMTLFSKADATVCGLGVCIAKTFQKGYKYTQELGYPCHFQAEIQSLNPLIVK